MACIKLFKEGKTTGMNQRDNFIKLDNFLLTRDFQLKFYFIPKIITESLYPIITLLARFINKP